jgi:DNA-directed RNA polymerase subunit M/transcription elongation factor TFIIS
MADAMRRSCPRCGSADVKSVDYLNITCVVCGSCGYDERQEYDVVAEFKPSSKVKGSFTPYKAGGAKRSVKR